MQGAASAVPADPARRPAPVAHGLLTFPTLMHSTGTRLAVTSLVVGPVLGALLLLAGPRPAAAQGRWVFTPSLSLAELYDDNIFGTGGKTDDFITQITPGLALAYEGDWLTLRASVSATGEIYAENSELDNFGENRDGVFTLGYRPDERLTLRLAGRYARTNDPSTFVILAAPVVPTVVAGTSAAPTADAAVVPTVGITRRETSQYTFLAGGDYRLDPRWSLTAGYAFALVDEEEGTDSRSHTGSAGTRYELTRFDQLSLDGRVAYFDGEDDTDTAVTGLLGWNRQWAPDLRTRLGAGPRVTDGVWGGAADASLTYLPARAWSVVLSYSLGTGLAVGEEGAQNVSALGASVGYQATRDLRFGVGGSWVRTWAIDDGGGAPGDETENTYGLSAFAAYQLTTWLSAQLSYRFTVEEPAPDDGTHHQVLLGLVFAYPFRF